MLGAGFLLPKFLDQPVLCAGVAPKPCVCNPNNVMKYLDQPVLCAGVARRLLRNFALLRCNVMKKQALLRFIFAKSLILKLCYMLRLFSGLSQSYEVVRAPRQVQNIPHNQILQTSYNIF